MELNNIEIRNDDDEQRKYFMKRINVFMIFSEFINKSKRFINK